jgi:hypothetical protein
MSFMRNLGLANREGDLVDSIRCVTSWMYPSFIRSSKTVVFRRFDLDRYRLQVNQSWMSRPLFYTS